MAPRRILARGHFFSRDLQSSSGFNIDILSESCAVRRLAMSRIALILLFAAVALPALAEDQPATEAASLAAQKERLAKMQSLVGEWRGVGQPQRSSTKDSWIAEAQWEWNFDKGDASLVGKLPKGRYFKSLKLIPGKE